MLKDHDSSGEVFLAYFDRLCPVTSPAVRLLAAILDDACFCLHPAAFVSPDTRADAIAWVRGEVRSAAHCSFAEVCDVLGLDVQAVRDALLSRARVQPSIRRTTARSPIRRRPLMPREAVRSGLHRST